MNFSFAAIIDKYRYSYLLLLQLVKTDFKLRYQSSVLGYLWSVLKPLAMFAVLYFVFVEFLRIGADIPHFAIYLLLGIVFWNYFMELTTGSVSAIVSKGDLIRKINFPKYVIVFSSSLSAVINLGINFVIIAVFMLVFGADPSWGALWAVPLSIIAITLLGLGIGLWLSALFVRYRDVAYIWEVISQAAFYATPILYPISVIPLLAQKVLILNPLAEAIQLARNYLVTPATLQIGDIWHNDWMVLVPISIVLITFVTGAMYFRANSRHFAEEV